MQLSSVVCDLGLSFDGAGGCILVREYLAPLDELPILIWHSVSAADTTTGLQDYKGTLMTSDR